jgi:hypothetical protein
MPTKINADTTLGGAIITGDSSGNLELQSAGVTKLTVASSGVTLANALPIASGGTNSTATPTAGAVPYGTGTALAYSAVGTSGQALVSAGAGAPAFGTVGISGGGTNSTATATAGGIGYGTGTAHAYTAVGTSGQFLQSAGAGVPVWATVSAPTAAQGASMVLVTTVTASSSSTVDVEDAMTDYDEYVILIDGVKPSNNSSILEGLLKIGGSYITTSTYQSTFQTISTTGTGISGTAFDAYPRIQYTIGNVTNVSTQNINGAVWITRPSSTSAYPTLRYDFVYGASNVSYYQRYIFGFINNSTTGSAVTGLRFSFDSGTIVTGSFRLYGFKKS